MMTKTAHAEATKMIAPIDQRDGGNAFELGFIKTAQALPLTDAQRQACYVEAAKSLQGK